MTGAKVFTWSNSQELRDAGAHPTVRYKVNRMKPVRQVADEMAALDLEGKALFIQNPLELGDDRQGEASRYFGTLDNDWNTLEDVRSCPRTRGLATGHLWRWVFTLIQEPTHLLHDVHGVPNRLNRMDRAHAIVGDRIFKGPTNGEWNSRATWPAGTDFTHWRLKWRDWTFGEWFDIREHLEYAAFTGPFRQVFGPGKEVFGYIEEPEIEGELSLTPESYGQRRPDDVSWGEFTRKAIRNLRDLEAYRKPIMLWIERAQGVEHATHNRWMLRYCMRNNIDVMYWVDDTAGGNDAAFVEDLKRLKGAA